MGKLRYSCAMSNCLSMHVRNDDDEDEDDEDDEYGNTQLDDDGRLVPTPDTHHAPSHNQSRLFLLLPHLPLPRHPQTLRSDIPKPKLPIKPLSIPISNQTHIPTPFHIPLTPPHQLSHDRLP